MVNCDRHTDHSRRAMSRSPSGGAPRSPATNVGPSPASNRKIRRGYAENRGAGGRARVLGTALRCCPLCGSPTPPGRAGRRSVASLVVTQIRSGLHTRPACTVWPRLADVRPHPSQGSRALHPLGRRECATSRSPRSFVLKYCSQRSSTAAPSRGRSQNLMQWRRSHRQARRHHARIRHQ